MVTKILLLIKIMLFPTLILACPKEFRQSDEICFYVGQNASHSNGIHLYSPTRKEFDQITNVNLYFFEEQNAVLFFFFLN